VRTTGASSRHPLRAIGQSDSHERFRGVEFDGSVGRFQNFDRGIACVIEPQIRCLVGLVERQLVVFWNTHAWRSLTDGSTTLEGDRMMPIGQKSSEGSNESERLVERQMVVCLGYLDDG